ncbi:MAG: PqqD family protein [Acidobacteriota bacterium]|nr:PqqD family protein [Acidobacteriota bacterium]
MQLLPLARQEDLITKDVSDELLVYDSRNDKAHCLNRTIAMIWQYCDGNTSVAQITQRINQELSVAVDEDFVWYALRQLERNRLLEERIVPQAEMAGITRRKLIFKYAPMALAVPIIMTITAPSAQAAASQPCLPSGAGCNVVNSVCCNGPCNPNTISCP